MEFSYRVSEKQYLQAMKLRVSKDYRSRRMKRIGFWVFILVCLIVLWTVVERTSHAPPVAGYPVPAATETGHSLNDLLVNVGLFVLIVGL